MALRLSCVLLALAALSCGRAAVRTARTDDGLRARDPAPASGTGCDLGAEEPRLCAVATIDADAGIADVTLHLDPAALPPHRREVTLSFDAPIEPEGRWPELGALPQAVELRYRVALDSGAPSPVRSFRRAGGWHLRGRSFLPELKVDGAISDTPATLRIDAGARPVWTSAGERRVVDANSLGRLADEAYEIGALTTTRREVDGTTVWVATGETSAEGLERAADVLARALGSLSERLGPPPTDGILVAFHASEASFTERLGSTVVQASPLGASHDLLFDAGEPALRELVRIFVPGAHGWLEDGIADYFTALVIAELAGAPPESVARVILRAHRRYATANGEAWTRDAGLVVGYCLDGHLRETGGSLGAALRTTLAREDSALGAEAFLEDLAAVSPASAGYLAALLEGEGAFAIDDCLERHGLEAREVAFEGGSDAALEAAFGSWTATALAQAFRVIEPAEGSPFEPGDVVTDVNGVRVAEPSELAWAMRELRAGDRVRVGIRRRGEPHIVELVAPEAPREERSRIELTPLEPAR